MIVVDHVIPPLPSFLAYVIGLLVLLGGMMLTRRISGLRDKPIQAQEDQGDRRASRGVGEDLAFV